MTNRQSFVIRNPRILDNALAAVREAQVNSRVTIADPQRTLDQNAKLHALLTDLARSPQKWAGKLRTLDEWKMLMVSGHAVATGNGGEVIPGIEGEFVAIRESTANMSVARASSLIEYVLAYCVMNKIELHETKRCGWLDEVEA